MKSPEERIIEQIRESVLKCSPGYCQNKKCPFNPLFEPPKGPRSGWFIRWFKRSIEILCDEMADQIKNDELISNISWGGRK